VFPYLLRFLRFHWDTVEAELVDQRFDKFVNNGDNPLQRWEYMVEVPGRDGAPVRLTFKEYLVKVDPPPVGSPVSVRVNRKRTKAMFDLRDPRVNRSMQTDAHFDAQRVADEERFRKKLDEPL
jgi:hypothetical protein